MNYMQQHILSLDDNIDNDVDNHYGISSSPVLAKNIHRKLLSIEDKVAIIRRIENGEMKSEVGKRYGISPSTVSTIWKYRYKLLESDVGGSSSICKKIRRPKYFHLDRVMLQWILNQISKNEPFTGSLIRSTAQKYAVEMGITDFKASEGWLEKFKQRHNICKGKIEGSDGIDWPTLTIANADDLMLELNENSMNSSSTMNGTMNMKSDMKLDSEFGEFNNSFAQQFNYTEPPSAQQALDAAKLLEQFLLHYEDDPKIHQDMARICTKIQTKYFQAKKLEGFNQPVKHFLD